MKMKLGIFSFVFTFLVIHQILAKKSHQPHHKNKKKMSKKSTRDQGHPNEFVAYMQDYFLKKENGDWTSFIRECDALRKFVEKYDPDGKMRQRYGIPLDFDLEDLIKDDQNYAEKLKIILEV